jgi:hypothetical protein
MIIMRIEVGKPEQWKQLMIRIEMNDQSLTSLDFFYEYIGDNRAVALADVLRHSSQK